MRQHLRPGQGRQFGRPARVVLVEVGEHHPPYGRRIVPQSGDRVGDRAAGAGWSGVDERQLVGVAPEIGLADRKTQQVQPGEERDDVHGTTVERAPPAGRGPLPRAERAAQLAAYVRRNSASATERRSSSSGETLSLTAWIWASGSLSPIRRISARG